MLWELLAWGFRLVGASPSPSGKDVGWTGQWHAVPVATYHELGACVQSSHCNREEQRLKTTS
eukprot:3700009-Amphidinium_carterae.1